MKKSIMVWTAAAAASVCGTAMADTSSYPTQASVLSEEFTAEWCGPCVQGYYSMERLKERWGNDVSVLTYNVFDIYETADTSARGTEGSVSAIPTFWFQGAYKQVGTYGTGDDARFDNYINQAKALPMSARAIARWSVNPSTEVLKVFFKLQADAALTSLDELRVVVHESHWACNCSNGLDEYQYKVQDMFATSIGGVAPPQQKVFNLEYNLSSNNLYRNWANVGVTVYIWDTAQRKVKGCWEIGGYTLGDLNGDLYINNTDATLFNAQLGKSEGDPGFNPAADFNQDGIITNADKQEAVAYIRGGGMR